MSAGVQYMDLDEFRDLGLLQEVNRQFLHPLGLSLHMSIDEDGRAVALAGILDGRSDPEGIIYEFPDGLAEAIEKMQRVEAMQAEAHERRRETLGYVIQEIEDGDGNDG